MAVGSIISPFALALGEQSPMKGKRDELRADIAKAEKEYEEAMQDMANFNIANPYESVGRVQAMGDVTGTLGIDTVSDRILQDQQAQLRAQTLAALSQQGPGASAAGVAQLLATQDEQFGQQREQKIRQQFRENLLLGVKGRESAAARALDASKANVERDLAKAAGDLAVQDRRMEQVINMADIAAGNLSGAEAALRADDAMYQALAGGVGTAIGYAVGGKAGGEIGGAIGSAAGALLT